MKDNLISVIVPIYNTEKYLCKCVDSIINQTYTNLEIILVNDGSSDNCGKICDEYAKKDNRIKVIHKLNGGLSDARNVGIKKAKGKYISFVDSDDYINKNMIDVLFNLQLSNKSDISIISYKVVYDNNIVDENFKKISEPIILNKYQALLYLFYDNKIGNYAWNKLYKKELFNNMEFPKGKKMEDLGTTYKLFELCEKIVYSDTELYYYLQRNNSILHDIDKKLCNDKFELAHERYLYLLNKYPLMKENNAFMFENSLRLYPFLSTYNKRKAERVIIKKNIKTKLSIKLKFRYYLYKLSKKIYIIIFLKRGFKE